MIAYRATSSSCSSSKWRVRCVLLVLAWTSGPDGWNGDCMERCILLRQSPSGCVRPAGVQIECDDSIASLFSTSTTGKAQPSGDSQGCVPALQGGHGPSS